MAEIREDLILGIRAESDDLGDVIRTEAALLGLGQEATDAAEELIDLEKASRKSAQEIEDLGQEITETSADTSRFDKSLDALRAGLDRAERESDGLRGSIDELRRKLKAAQTAAKKTGGGFKKASEILKGFQRRIGEIALEKLIAGLKAGVGAVAEFSEAMSQVKGITNATEEEFNALSDSAQKLGATTSFTAAQAATAQRELAKAGFDTGQILEATNSTLTLALVGFTDLAEAAKIASVQVKAFGGEASDLPRFVDQLALSANSATTSVGDLHDGLAKVAGTAVSFNETMGEAAKTPGELQAEMLGLLQVLADAGKVGQEAGTGLRMAFAQMIQLRSGSATAEAALKQLGLTAEDLNPATHGLTGAILNLAKGNMEAGVAFELVGAKAADTIQILAQHTEEIKENQAALADSAGFAEKLAAVFGDNLPKAYNAAISAAQNLAISFAKTGGMDAATTSLEILTNNLRAMQPVAEDLGNIFGVAMAVINVSMATTADKWTRLSFTIREVNAKAMANIGELARAMGAALETLNIEGGQSLREFGESMKAGAADRMEESAAAIKKSSEAAAATVRRVFQEDLPAIFDDVTSSASGMSDELKGSLDKIVESSEGVKEALDRDLAKGTADAVEAAGEAAGQLPDTVGQALDKTVESIKTSMSELDGTELESFRAKTMSELDALAEDFRDKGMELPEPLIEAFSLVSDAGEKFAVEAGVSLKALQATADDVAIGIRGALAAGIPQGGIDDFSAAAKAKVEGVLDAFERIGVEPSVPIQKLADELKALPESLRLAEERVNALTEGLATKTGKAAAAVAQSAADIAAGFENLANVTEPARDRFRQMTDGIMEAAAAAGVDTPASIMKIRQELGFMAEDAEAAVASVADALGGLSEIAADDELVSSKAVQEFFADIVAGSDESKAAFAALDANARGALRGIADDMVVMAQESSLTGDELAGFEEKMRAVIGAGSDGASAATDYANAWNQVGQVASTAGQEVDHGGDAIRNTTEAADGAVKSFSNLEDNTAALAERLALPSAEEGAEALGKTADAAERTSTATTDAAESMAKAGEQVANYGAQLSDATEGADDAAAANERIGESAEGALSDASSLLAKLQELTGLDLSGLVAQFGQVDAAVQTTNGVVTRLRESIRLTKEEAHLLAESLLNAQSVGGEGGEGAPE